MKRKPKKLCAPHCPYCGHTAVLKPATLVYGEKTRVKFLYVCSQYPQCDAYVGVHEKTMEPLGTLADGALRHKRIRAHRLFDQIWQSGIMDLSGAYLWLRSGFGLNYKQGHIGEFSDYYCEQLIHRSEELLHNNKIA